MKLLKKFQCENFNETFTLRKFHEIYHHYPQVRQGLKPTQCITYQHKPSVTGHNELPQTPVKDRHELVLDMLQLHSHNQRPQKNKSDND